MASVEVYLWFDFKKNTNSTKRPEPGQSRFNCYLIEPVSILNPVIRLRIPWNPYNYNYAYIPDFHRYYYITDIVSENTMWTCYMTVDVLATYRNIIGKSTQYVVRSSSDWDGNISDSLYPTKTRPEIVTTYPNSETYPFSAGVGFGYFVVGIINNSPDALGCVSYYRFTMSEFRQFCNAMLSTSDWLGGDFGDVTDDLLKSIFNPFQYVVSCVQYPSRFAIFPGTAVENIAFGWWTLPVSATLITSSLEQLEVTFQLPEHPQAATRGAYLNSAPFSRYTLYWDAFGVYELDAQVVANASNDGGEKQIQAKISFDCSGATATLRINNGNVQQTLVDTTVQVGVPIQIAQATSDVIGSFQSLGNALTSAFSLNFIGAGASLFSSLEHKAPKITSSGANGSSAKYAFLPVLQSEFYLLVDEALEHRGRPLCQQRVISSLPGYIMTADAEIEISECMSTELDKIKDYMNGGFFYE